MSLQRPSGGDFSVLEAAATRHLKTLRAHLTIISIC